MPCPLEGTRVTGKFWNCKAYIPKDELEQVIQCDHFSKYFSEKRQLNVPRAIMIKRDTIKLFGFEATEWMAKDGVTLQNKGIEK